MNVYGLMIGSAGIEFPSREDRDKAIKVFTNGSSIEISESCGVRYKPSQKVFGTYERDTSQVMAKCSKCLGIFTNETCSERSVPAHKSYPKHEEFSDEMREEWLCDGCYAHRMQAKKVYDAQKTVEAAS